jgi:hypothetical protein
MGMANGSGFGEQQQAWGNAPAATVSVREPSSEENRHATQTGKPQGDGAPLPRFPIFWGFGDFHDRSAERVYADVCV